MSFFVGFLYIYFSGQQAVTIMILVVAIIITTSSYF